MRLLRPNARPAFSLMEMVLALALGMLLLLALYLTLNTHLLTAQAGRDIVAESTLARNILNRIADDITNHLGAADMRGLGDASAPPVDPADPMASMTPTTPTPTPVKFNLGVHGEPDFLRLSSYRVQKPRGAANGADAPAEIFSEVRRINYWIVTNGSETLGLARAEVKQATSADVDVLPTAFEDQNKYIIAPQVKSIAFEYYDGSSGVGSGGWRGTWMGDEVLGSLDGSGQPTGPPSAIRITLTLRRSVKGMAASDTPNADGPTFQHIVAMPTSNSFKAYDPQSTP